MSGTPAASTDPLVPPLDWKEATGTGDKAGTQAGSLVDLLFCRRISERSGVSRLQIG